MNKINPKKRGCLNKGHPLFLVHNPVSYDPMIYLRPDDDDLAPALFEAGAADLFDWLLLRLTDLEEEAEDPGLLAGAE